MRDNKEERAIERRCDREEEQVTERRHDGEEEHLHGQYVEVRRRSSVRR